MGRLAQLYRASVFPWRVLTQLFEAFVGLVLYEGGEEGEGMLSLVQRS